MREIWSEVLLKYECRLHVSQWEKKSNWGDTFTSEDQRLPYIYIYIIYIIYIYLFYIRGSVHRNSRLKKSNEMQQYADIYLLLNYSVYFWRPSRPSSGVHKTVVAASGTDHTVWGASFFKRDKIRTRYLAVNKYLHNVASRWISSTSNIYIYIFTSAL